jgi:chromosome segregation ATPase
MTVPARSNSDFIQSNTEAIRNLEQVVARLDERIDNVRDRLANLARGLESTQNVEHTVAVLAERVDVVRRDAEKHIKEGEQTQQELKRLQETIADTNQQIDVVKQQHAELQRDTERLDQRAWAVRLALLSAAISGIVSLAVALVSKAFQ